MLIVIVALAIKNKVHFVKKTDKEEEKQGEEGKIENG
jgi:hypothetical protein